MYRYYLSLGLLGPIYKYRSLGCWKDDKDRAIAGEKRKVSSIQECFNIADSLGNNVFAVESNDECFTASTAKGTYKNHGPCDNCESDGLGGHWCMEVYEILGIFLYL